MQKYLPAAIVGLAGVFLIATMIFAVALAAAFTLVGGGGGSGQTAGGTTASCANLKSVPKGYADYFCESGSQYKVEPAFVASIVYYENRGFPGGSAPWKASFPCSPAGACGVAQFIASTFASVGVDGKLINQGDGGQNGRKDRNDFSDAIFSSAKYLASIGGKPKMTEAQVKTAACHYNGGPGCSLGIPETADYVVGVAKAWKNFGGGI